MDINDNMDVSDQGSDMDQKGVFLQKFHYLG